MNKSHISYLYTFVQATPSASVFFFFPYVTDGMLPFFQKSNLDATSF